MDYMREINAFYDWAEINEVPPSGILLWHALMFLANRARWPKRLTVPISTLEQRAGIKRSTIFTARARLKQLGRISFESRDGNQSAVYTIIPFCVQKTDTSVDGTVDTSVDATTDANMDHITSSPSVPSEPSEPRKTKTPILVNNNLREPDEFGIVLSDADEEVRQAILACGKAGIVIQPGWNEGEIARLVTEHTLPWVAEAARQISERRIENRHIGALKLRLGDFKVAGRILEPGQRPNAGGGNNGRTGPAVPEQRKPRYGTILE